MLLYCCFVKTYLRNKCDFQFTLCAGCARPIRRRLRLRTGENAGPSARFVWPGRQESEGGCGDTKNEKATTPLRMTPS